MFVSIYNFSSRFVGLFLSVSLLAGALFAYIPTTYAQADNQFSSPYGLIVHNKNQDQLISRVKTLEVLLKYFSNANPTRKSVPMAFTDVSEDQIKTYVQKGCDLDLFNCSRNNFYPHRPINQHDFLEWFFKLKYNRKPNFLQDAYPKIKTETLRRLREARRLNLLVGDQITYQSFQQFLYRNQVVESNLNQPFSYTLTLNFEDINLANYHNLKEIDFIQGNLKRIISHLEEKKNTSKEIRYLRDLKKQVQAFDDLKEALAASPYVLQEHPELDPEVIRLVREYGLQEVLYSYSYNYSQNALYRQHNLLTGVKKMHGRIFEPGGVIDFWNILSERGLSEFQYGWVIAGGTEEWQFGGGICGSSSLVFLPSWKAGLEILERSNHSKYFSYLYPIADIGLDATVYRPRPNLKIRNNTFDPIVFNVVDDKENKTVTVQVIGNSPYKEVRIEGPIFISRSHIKWIRHLEDFNGNITSEALESRYSVIY
ncbi:VanW family protein [Patescibacteria group bacterium]|nr:VanW family protein [Patescibacteria group bacterium]